MGNLCINEERKARNPTVSTRQPLGNKAAKADIIIEYFKRKSSKWTKCLKNQPCNVIKMREMRGEVGKKNLKKEMDNPSFL